MRLIDADKLLGDIEKYHVSDGKFQHWVQIQQTVQSDSKETSATHNALDTISRQAAYDALMAEPLKWDDSSVWESARCHQWMMDMDVIKALPPAQTELEDKILAIGYTGEEGHIYIGGRLFAVRELAQ